MTGVLSFMSLQCLCMCAVDNSMCADESASPA